MRTATDPLLNYPLAEGLVTSRLALGCMHFAGNWEPRAAVSAEARAAARTATETALELGWNFFDHADIYCRRRSEQVFGEIWCELGVAREDLILQSKCGIRFAGDGGDSAPHRFDFSPEHIEASVEASLRNLKTDYLDILLLHRPDLLMEPEVVAACFARLRDAGKVRYFGVSNFTPPLLQLLKSAGIVPVANQVELNLLRTSLLDCSVVSDEGRPMAGHPADGTLEYHRRKGIVTQAWAPLAYGYPAGRPADWDAPRVEALQREVAALAAHYGVAPQAIVVAWLLRHPAGIQPIIGTRDPQRLRECHQALSIRLEHADWYRLYLAGRGRKLP